MQFLVDAVQTVERHHSAKIVLVLISRLVPFRSAKYSYPHWQL